MIKFITILFFYIMHIPVYAQPDSTAQISFIFNCKTLAAEIGKTYQRAQNCGQDLTNLSASSTATLFRKYLAENEVTIVMKQFNNSASKENGRACNLEEINVQALIIKIGDYMRIAAPHVLPEHNDK